MDTQSLTREQVLQCVTSAILEGNTEKAKAMIKEAREYEKMTGRFVLSSITLRDLHQAIVEKELQG